MDILEIIDKKRNGKILKKEELQYVIDHYLNGDIKDYQMSSLLMAITIKGMTDQEIIHLTDIMLQSGERLDLSSLSNVVDKHSTGGVGDKTTMIVSPIVASCGVNVAKMSGRGLGHTGGTIDKLESIPGFQVNMTTSQFLNQVKKIGIGIVSQTSDLVPADKKIYALRDVTGTVGSDALIASSIMSKKIASGANKLVIDVKVGQGALMKNLKGATRLANLMIKIGQAHHMKVICLLTNMDIPLGNNIGNALEVKEAIDILRNQKRGNLLDLCVELSSYMVSLGLEISYEEAREKVLENLKNGHAYRKFLEFVHEQQGDLALLPESTYVYEVKSPEDGFLANIDALKLGNLSMHLGAGRENLEDHIDYGAGIVLHKNVGDKVDKGDLLMSVYTSKNVQDLQSFISAFQFSKVKVEHPTLIYTVIK